ncbi:hypothetical protein V8G54_026557, partial [Vigna mungo]
FLIKSDFLFRKPLLFGFRSNRISAFSPFSKLLGSFHQRTDSIQLTSLQFSFFNPRTGNSFPISDTTSSAPPRNKATIVAFKVFPSACNTNLMKSLLSVTDAIFCHPNTKSAVLSSQLFSVRKIVTFSGTGRSLMVNDTTTPKLAPPPPLIAQNRSSPMPFLSRRFPFTSTIFASITLS